MCTNSVLQGNQGDGSPTFLFYFIFLLLLAWAKKAPLVCISPSIDMWRSPKCRRSNLLPLSCQTTDVFWLNVERRCHNVNIAEILAVCALVLTLELPRVAHHQALVSAAMYMLPESFTSCVMVCYLSLLSLIHLWIHIHWRSTTWDGFPLRELFPERRGAAEWVLLPMGAHSFGYGSAYARHLIAPSVARN